MNLSRLISMDLRSVISSIRSTDPKVVLSYFTSTGLRPVIAEEQKEKQKNYLVSAFWAAISVSIILGIWPNALPFSFLQLWSTTGSPSDWLTTAAYVFLWGAGITALVSIITHNKPEENRNAEVDFEKGFFISLWAGVMEEICFRWLIFMSSMIGAIVANYIFFGFLGFGIAEWLQIHFLGPIANFFTLGLLQHQLANPELWYVGAGILAANAFFRDGHKYLGFFGFVNSWFIGMFMFYLLFTYGLLSCILVHFLYDLAIFAVRYVDCVIERAQGRV